MINQLERLKINIALCCSNLGILNDGKREKDNWDIMGRRGLKIYLLLHQDHRLSTFCIT